MSNDAPYQRAYRDAHREQRRRADAAYREKLKQASRSPKSDCCDPYLAAEIVRLQSVRVGMIFWIR